MTQHNATSTPLLNFEKELPQTRVDQTFKKWSDLNWQRSLLVLAIIFGLAGGLVVLSHVLGDSFTARVDHDGDNLVSVLLGFYLAMYPAVAIHELGHVLAGWVAGYKFLSVRIVNFTLVWNTKKIKLLFNKATTIDGLTLMHMPERGSMRWRHFIYISGGPLANLVSAALLEVFVASWAFDQGSPNLFSPRGLAHGAILTSALTGIFNLLPGYNRKSKRSRDGQRLLLMLFEKEAAEGFRALSRLAKAEQQGIHWRELDENWIRQALAIKDKSPEAVQALLFSYARHIANDRVVEAAADQREDIQMPTLLLIRRSQN